MCKSQRNKYSVEYSYIRLSQKSRLTIAYRKEVHWFLIKKQDKRIYKQTEQFIKLQGYF